MKSIEEYLLARIVKRAAVDGFTDCWEWTLVPSANGYGRTNRLLNRESAHRVSYRHFKGEIPDGHHIDHLCFNRICINPDHLEAVTPRENVIRAERHAGSPGYSVRFLEKRGFWRTVVDVGSDGGRRKQQMFYGASRDIAVQKMEAFLRDRSA